ncbi:hypothetical protein BH10ACT1_BH10ACT1_04910 [soil metagenome]
MPEFLSDAWFVRARELMAGVQGPPDVDLRLQHVADGTRWHQVVQGGVVTQWAAGDLDGAELEVHLPLAVARGVLGRTVTGTAASSACTVVGPGAGPLPPPPLDIERRPELADLPEMVGADLRVQFHFSAGPFGDVDYWWRFVDGRSSAMGFGLVEEPEVSVWIPYSHMVGVRNGAISIYEALEGGRVDGAVGPLMLLAGLQESPELHAAELACGPAGTTLAALGRLTADASHRAALDLLDGETT